MSGAEGSITAAGLSGATLITQVFREASAVSGYVADPTDWSKRWIVELLIDGWPVQVARSDRFDRRMPDYGQPVLDFGFAFDLRRLSAVRWSSLEVRLANSDIVLAHIAADIPTSRAPPSSPGAVVWQGGLRFSGWLVSDLKEVWAIRGMIDEDLIFESRTFDFKMIDDGQIYRSRPAFDVHLPLRFADGRVRKLHVIDHEGQPLTGSPVSFFAFEDGLAAVLNRQADAPGERIRGSEFDRMFPQSVPFEAVATWSARFFPERELSSLARFALVLVGDDGVDESLESLKASLQDGILGVLPSASNDGRFNGNDLADFLTDDASDCSIVVLALSGTLFSHDSVYRLAAALSATAADLAYCDVYLRSERPAHGPHLLPIAFPSFDYERMMEQGYAAWCFAIKIPAALLAARAGVDSLLGLFLHALGMRWDAEKAPIHVPGFLATLPTIDHEAAGSGLKSAVIKHLADRGIRAEADRGRGLVFPSIFVRRAITAETVSVVVPTHNAVDEVRNCVDHLRGLRTRHKLELIIADMASSEPALLRYFARSDMRAATHVRIKGPFNMARALNQGAAHATGRHLFFLDPGVQLEDPDPLENLMSRCADVTTAAAGATLVWPGGIIQSAGLVLSHAFGATPVGRGLGDADCGYGDLMSVAQERSAISAACLLVKRDDHLALRGFDENAFGRAYFAVDYGLRLRARGRRLVVTPHARATCKRDIFFNDALGPENFGALAYRRELATLRLRWGDVLNHDPFYSPLLALNGDLFSALAWPPRYPPLPSS